MMRVTKPMNAKWVYCWSHTVSDEDGDCTYTAYAFVDEDGNHTGKVYVGGLSAAMKLSERAGLRLFNEVPKNWQP